MKDLLFNTKKLKIDSISKFNLYNKKDFCSFNHLVFFSKINSNDTNFFRDFFFLSKLFTYWFNLKISILFVVKEKKKAFNKGKNSLIFFFGCALRNKNFLYMHLNYIFNILFISSKKIDGLLKYKKVNKGFIFSFSNLNHLLGFKSDRFFNINIKINIFFNFFKKNENKQVNNFNNNIINFYEKVFF